MASAAGTLNYLYDLQRFGIKAGLDNIRALCRHLGNPEQRFPCIHIAGTNGKGSTASMIASVLTASGYRTGLYTSPHLVSFSERIRIDGIKISNRAIIRYTGALKSRIDKFHATFFEATTAIAFQYFADSNIDVAVIETGLGGRWDATNIIVPLLSIITNIGLDHTEHLGKTYAKIAFEKGGIIKPLVPCITGVTKQHELPVLRKLARERNAPLINVDKESDAVVKKSSLNGLVVDLRTKRNVYEHLSVGLAGSHQVRNVQLAVLALEYLRGEGSFTAINARNMRKGLTSIRANTGLRGRFDILSQSPRIVADVAHNPDGIRTVVRACKELLRGKGVSVFGVMEDKPYRKMIDQLIGISRVMIAVRPRTDRALRSSVIVNEAHKRSARCLDGDSVENGMEMAVRDARAREPILVVGSHYVVGEVLKLLKIIP